MGIRVLYDADQNNAVLYDSVTMKAFGPVMDGAGNADARDVAEDLITYYRTVKNQDLRKAPHDELVDAYIAIKAANEDFPRTKDEDD